MRLNSILLILSFTVPIAFHEISLATAEMSCQSTISVDELFAETSSYKLFSNPKKCELTQAEALQNHNCWEPGDLLSQKRYCLEEGLTEIGTALRN